MCDTSHALLAPATRVWIGPQVPPDVLDAVLQSGGTVSDQRDAEVVIWCCDSHDLTQAPDAIGDTVQWVQIDCAGVDHWVAADLIDGDRRWTSCRGIYSDTVAEHALALLLTACRRLDTAARTAHWLPVQSRTLADSTVSVLGLGGIGTALVERLRPHGPRILAIDDRNDRVVSGVKIFGPDELHRVLAESDLAVITLPLTERTRHLMGEREFALLGPNASLINVSRGAVVKTDELVTALASGALGGAYLDVTDPEPLPADHPLWTAENALITSHSANPRERSMRSYAALVASNLRAYRAGESLSGTIHLSRGY
jgi:D-3-phosphoglycerate dehydrogenase